MGVGSALAVFGLWLLWSRWRVRAESVSQDPARWPLVSVIVPARDEAQVIGRLIRSLNALDYPDYEVLVVDDESQDGTAEVVRRAGGEHVRVLTGLAKPAGWGGKQWACHQGARAARGEFLLFTDADTEHASFSLREAVKAVLAKEAGLASTLPFHSGAALWERLTGPFHVLLLAVTDPFGKARPGRVFAIGQYLLFRRDAYDLMGGHESVRAELVEDLPLANRCLRLGIPYYVISSDRPLFSVRMYDTPMAFLRGWRRNFRAGLGGSSLVAPLEMTAMVAALAGGGVLSWWAVPLAIGGVALTVRAQRRLGAFSVLGAVLFPWSLGLLCLVTGLATFDMLTRKATVWKGRSYLEPIKNRAP